MKVLQVKYFHSEKETNDFLKTIDASSIQSIEHIVETKQECGPYYTIDGDLRYKTETKTEVITVVRYYIEETCDVELTPIPFEHIEHR